MLKDASNECASQVYLTRPISEHLYIGRSYDTHHYFVKELRRKNLHGKAGKYFRALDNDVKLKFKNCGRHFLPSALITKLLSFVRLRVLQYLL